LKIIGISQAEETYFFHQEESLFPARVYVASNVKVLREGSENLRGEGPRIAARFLSLYTL